MTIQFSVAIRNAMADQVEGVIGASAVLRMRTGAKPADCAAADSGTVLATMTLPASWLNAAAAGVVTISGLWQDLLADAAGTIGHFRIYDSTGTVCGCQGSVTITGGGGDMTVDNPVLAVGQPITVTLFTLTAPNAYCASEALGRVGAHGFVHDQFDRGPRDH